MRIAILTSGGDAPGMNATIVNLVHDAIKSKHEVYLVEDGYDGLLDNKFSLVTNEFAYDENLTLAGSFIYCARSTRFITDYQIAINNLKTSKIDCLIVIGGNGSYQGAQLLAKQVKVIFIPASIDNDVHFSDYALGFSSAANEIVCQAKKNIATFKTHKNIIFLEVMGRYNSDLAIAASKLINPALTITHENKFTPHMIASKLFDYYKQHKFALVIVSEHIYDQNQINEIIRSTQEQVNCQVRWSVLGYSQRGANVDETDLSRAREMASLAINLINQNIFNTALFYSNKELKNILFSELNKKEL